MLPKNGAFTQHRVEKNHVALSTVGMASMAPDDVVVIPLIEDGQESVLDPNKPMIHRENPAHRPNHLVNNVTANKRKALLLEFYRDYIQQHGDASSTDTFF